jgi:hypothetical protein
MPVYTKYTKQVLEPFVASSYSVSEVIRKLGLHQTGGTHSNIVRWIKIYKLDTSHFLGKGHNKNKVPSNKKSPSDILILRDEFSRPLDAYILRRALVESGVVEKCSICGIGNEWNGKPLQLQVDHINGCRWDNRIKNLRFACPNCHSQTENFGAKNKH